MLRQGWPMPRPEGRRACHPPRLRRFALDPPPLLTVGLGAAQEDDGGRRPPQTTKGTTAVHLASDALVTIDLPRYHRVQMFAMGCHPVRPANGPAEVEPYVLTVGEWSSVADQATELGYDGLADTIEDGLAKSFHTMPLFDQG